MSEQTPRKPGIPPTPWAPMLTEVHRIVRSHPWLEELRSAAKRPEDGPMVHGHEMGVYAVFGAKGRGEFQLEARISIPKWWEPERYTFEHHAIRLAGYLAAELRRKWREEPATPEQ